MSQTHKSVNYHTYTVTHSELILQIVHHDALYVCISNELSYNYSKNVVTVLSHLRSWFFWAVWGFHEFIFWHISRFFWDNVVPMHMWTITITMAFLTRATIANSDVLFEWQSVTHRFSQWFSNIWVPWALHSNLSDGKTVLPVIRGRRGVRARHHRQYGLIITDWPTALEALIRKFVWNELQYHDGTNDMNGNGKNVPKWMKRRCKKQNKFDSRSRTYEIDE